MSPLETIGWIGQACFFSRFLVQWLASERAGRSLAPPSFWWITLGAALALGTYTAGRGEVVLLMGQLVGASIALRNLALASGSRRSLPLPVAIGLGLGAWALGLFLALTKLTESPVGGLDGRLWFGVSIIGQTVWTSRFVLQWIESERQGTSHFPPLFWWISLAGNSLLLAYTLHLGDPILIAGHVLGPIVQVRNLVLMSRQRQHVVA